MEKLRVNDEVIVVAGKSKGRTGFIDRIDKGRNRVIVKGVNMVKKTIRSSQENPDGGIVDKEAPLHISNVALMSPKTKKATRVRIEKKDGKNIRVAVACGSQLDN